MSLPIAQFDFKSVGHSIDAIRTMLDQVEAYMKTLPQIEPPVKHYFGHETAGREMAMNADDLVMGKIHKFKAINVLLEGEVTVYSIDGEMHLRAGDVFVSSPGAKRMIYAHKASRWLVIHGTAETDLEKLENEVIAKDYSDVAELPARDVAQIEGV